MANKPYYLTVPENAKVTKYTVTTLGYDTLDKYNIVGWKIVWNNTKRQIGCCHYNTKTITLSVFLFDRMVDKRKMLDTVLHEIAHVLAGPGNGHNRIWKSWCIKVGAKPERCEQSKSFEFKTTDHKYNYVCKVHGIVDNASRLPKRKASCPKCSHKYNENYLLQVVQNW